MHEWLPLFSAAVSLATLCILAWIALRRPPAFGAKDSTLNQTTPTAVMAAPRFNPLAKLSFREALDRTRVVDTVQQALGATLGRHLQSLGNLGETAAVIQSTTLKEGQIVVQFSREAAERLSDGSAKRMGDLAIAVDSKTGQILSHAREVSPDTLSKIASLGPAIVSAAHAISAWDNARKLKHIGESVSALLEGRQIDKLSRLESVYETAREVLSTRPPDAQVTLREARRVLKELRSAWFQEMTDRLLDIEDPAKRGLLERFFTRKAAAADGIKQALSDQERIVYFIWFSTTLEGTIAEQMGERQAFLDLTLPAIKSQAEDARKLYAERKDWVAKLMGPEGDSVPAERLLENLQSSLS
jgi:hypothetical protein